MSLVCLGVSEAVDLEALSQIVFSRAPVLSGDPFPQLDFRNMGGATIFSVLGLEWFGRFDCALSRFRCEPAGTDLPRRCARLGRCPVMPPYDPARAPFCRLCDTGAEVAITLDRVGLRQTWRGRIDSFSLAMGMLTVIIEDFQLHIEAGAIQRWETAPGRHTAVGREGRALGLSLVSEALN